VVYEDSQCTILRLRDEKVNPPSEEPAIEAPGGSAPTPSSEEPLIEGPSGRAPIPLPSPLPSLQAP
jgi:hypothetical protein